MLINLNDGCHLAALDNQLGQLTHVRWLWYAGFPATQHFLAADRRLKRTSCRIDFHRAPLSLRIGSSCASIALNRN